MSEIGTIEAREILDSRGNPTLEVDVRLRDGVAGRAAVPSGASTGRSAAVELRDPELREFGGCNVSRAVASVRDVIATAMRHVDASDQARCDALLCALDGTEDKGRLGANALLGVSMAIARAAAASAGVPLYRHLGGDEAVVLPVPFLDVLNGGAHADNGLDLEEFMIAPIGASSFREALEMGSTVYRALAAVLKRTGHSVATGDMGGFAPRLKTNEQAFELILRAIEDAGFSVGHDVVLAVDVAANTLYRDERYVFRLDGRELSSDEMINLYADWVRQYSIFSIEDGLAEDDWDEWELLTIRLGLRVQIVGDDLLATNVGRIRQAASDRIANAVLIKLNQIGTVTESLAAITEARRAGYGVMIAHRSGETTDDFLADFAVATSAGQIKAGAPCRGERVAKYNQLLRIEEALGQRARYHGEALRVLWHRV